MASSDRDILPDSVKPVHYGLSLFDIEFQEPFGYKGTVDIELKVLKPTHEIVLNAHQLTIEAAELVTSNGERQQVLGWKHDLADQRTVFSLGSEAAPGTVTLKIAYGGTVNNIMAGFYRSKYKSTVPAPPTVPREGEFELMLSTQFESCDARRALPCFDEPNLKATFDFEIEVPQGLAVLANMPEKATRPGKNDRVVVAFERTPIMSTYLLAWAVGDFEYVEDFTRRKYNGKALPVRVYTTRGLREQGRWGLEHAHQIVDYFSEIFRLDYPLPKVDLLAVHEFAQGAMENWGLITYRTTAILFDEKSSDARYRKRIAYVVAHELAHQWFGNLVTMDWWNELWLNESFATWVGYLAVDHVHPDWDQWAQFAFDAATAAFNIDGLRSSHPIEVPVRNALEVDQIFDAISYYKGSCMIRMLSSYLGVPTFLAGVAEYLEARPYGNATTGDLWAALSAASGKDVQSFMDPWIKKVGHPVVTVAEEPGQLGVRQSRFLLGGGVKPEDDATVWWVPLGLTTDLETLKTDATALTEKETTLRRVDEQFYKLNVNATGFYRTNYPPNRLTKLGQVRERLSAPDRISLVSDAAALAAAGEGTTAGLLALCAEFKEEKNYYVWSQILSSLSTVRSVFATNEKIRAGLKKFVLQLISPAVRAIGWTFPAGEDFLTGQLRALLLSAAGGVEEAATLATALELFKREAEGIPGAVHPDLRLAVYRTAVQAGGADSFDQVLKLYHAAASGETRELCLTALGRARDPRLVREFLAFQMGDDVAMQDAHAGAAALANNAAARPELWAWTKENWAAVEAKLGGNAVALDRWVRVSLKHFARRQVLEEMEAFFKTKDTKAFDRSLVQVFDAVRGNAAYFERDEKVLLEYLEAHGYA